MTQHPKAVPNRVSGRSAAGAGGPLTLGFTLIEVLVALVILSVGLLGVAKMSLSTVQANDSAFMRSQATALIQQIVDNMRANQPEAAAGGYDIVFAANPGAAPACLDSNCSALQIATYDLSNWTTLLGANLPNGEGQIATATATSSTGAAETTATISVRWDDSVAQGAFGAPAAPVTITVETLL